MPKNKEKIKQPIVENHQTASWANIYKTKPTSEVPLPNKVEVENAKEWEIGRAHV